MNEREGPGRAFEPEEVDPEDIRPVAPEAATDLTKGRRGDPEDSSLDPSDQSNEGGDLDERGPR